MPAERHWAGSRKRRCENAPLSSITALSIANRVWPGYHVGVADPAVVGGQNAVLSVMGQDQS